MQTKCTWKKSCICLLREAQSLSRQPQRTRTNTGGHVWVWSSPTHFFLHVGKSILANHFIGINLKEDFLAVDIHKSGSSWQGTCHLWFMVAFSYLLHAEPYLPSLYLPIYSHSQLELCFSTQKLIVLAFLCLKTTWHFLELCFKFCQRRQTLLIIFVNAYSISSKRLLLFSIST